MSSNESSDLDESKEDVYPPSAKEEEDGSDKESNTDDTSHSFLRGKPEAQDALKDVLVTCDQIDEKLDQIPIKRKRGRPSKKSVSLLNGNASHNGSYNNKPEVERRKSDPVSKYQSPIPNLKKRGRKRGQTKMSGAWTPKSNLGRPVASNPKELICELGREFYTLGWVSGTGGGISIRDGEKIFVAPSGVQKERLNPKDLFTIDMDGNELAVPDNAKLTKSQCTPLFLLAYNLHNSGAVIHSHSKNAVIATLAYPGDVFKVTHLEMIKGIYHPIEKRQLRYDETLIVPIIENTPFERDLEESMHEAMLKYPETNAVLVRRHGVYVWGDTWEKAKTMAECYDYLFEMAAQMTRFNLDPTQPPQEAATEKATDI